MSLISLALASTLTLTQVPPSVGDPGVIDGGQIKLVEEVELAAPEAGILMAMDAKEGLQVATGQPLGRIDDRKAKMALDIAKAQLDAAQLEYESDINVLVADASLDVATVALDLAEEANRKMKGTFTYLQLVELKHKKREAQLHFQYAQHQNAIAERTVAVHQAQVAAAQLDMELRLVKSPLNGEVVEVMKNVGEWVQAGETVMRIYRLDKVKFETSLPYDQIAQSQVEGKPVTVEVVLSHGQTATFQGTIVNARPELDEGGARYAVQAEIENRMVDGHWQLLDGMRGRMTIHWQ